MKTNWTPFLLPFCLFFFFSIPMLQSQNGYKLSNSIDLVVGGDFGFRLIQDQRTVTGGNTSNNREDFENYRLNYRIGLNYIHGLTHNLSLKSGLRFSNPGFSISKINKIDPHQDINTIKKTYAIDGAEYSYKYQLIEIPIGIRYVMTKSVCEPYFELGLATNIYWRSMIQEKSKAGGTNNTAVNEKIRRFNYIGFLSVGGNFYVSEKLTGFTQLIGRYQLNNLRDGDLVEKLISMGLEIGLRHYL